MLLRSKLFISLLALPLFSSVAIAGAAEFEKAEELQKPSSSSGEKIFDWSKYKDADEVPHPYAEKGLIRITKDRTYIYRIDESEHHRAAAFHVGMYDPTNLSNPDTGATFAENYDTTSNPELLFDLEWQLWRTPIGKIGFQVGTGAYIAQGHGHFVHNYSGRSLTPREILTFAMVPINVGAVYRFQFSHRQLFVPYAGGGASLIAFSEIRNDNKAPKFGGAADAYYDGGLAIDMTYFDAVSRLQLDREYGISSIYLTVEYRGIVALTKKFDFSSDLINAGFLMEY